MEGCNKQEREFEKMTGKAYTKPHTRRRIMRKLNGSISQLTT